MGNRCVQKNRSKTKGKKHMKTIDEIYKEQKKTVKDFLTDEEILESLSMLGDILVIMGVQLP